MDHHVATEILACLQGERTVFPYFRDRYGIGLLRQLSRQLSRHRRTSHGLNVADLKQSRYASLLQKPRIRAMLAGLGHQAIDEAYLALHDHDPQQTHFVLTLSTWGSEQRRERRYRQTSRPGLNLVLQLNFSAVHDRLYRTLGCPHSRFNYHAHPVSQQRNTLAWARIDLDLDSNSALIEEVQSDWIRKVARLDERVELKLANGYPDSAPVQIYGLQCSLATARAYAAHVREHYAPIWSEAMLWASIQFIRDELGLEALYYHSEQGGQLFKGINGTPPPRSLYTDLPRRFCFTPTREIPPFLSEDKEVRQVLRRNPEIGFFRLL
jgi:hypothetical protein